MSEWVFDWWIRIAWWTPDAKAVRALRCHSDHVVRTVARISQAPESDVEDAVEQAFLALHRRYVRGRAVQNVRLWAARYALTIMERRLVK
jgi:DNA-directed RNA polymerase specialized sigma24 family protein